MPKKRALPNLIKFKKKRAIILFVLILFLIAIDYSLLDEFLKNWLINYEIGIAERVIDGDTIVVNSSNIRLLGINSPEKGERYYEEATSFLEEKVFGELVKLEKGKEDLDKYNRKLRYVFLNKENINLEIVENGFANFYFPSGKDKYYKEFKKAWEECIKSNKNLCKASEDHCSKCIELREFNNKAQKVVFYNRCDFDCELTNWEIEEEGRKRFLFPNFILKKGKEASIFVKEGKNNSTDLFWKGEEEVWTDAGDTLFLRDTQGKLVLWKNY